MSEDKNKGGRKSDIIDYEKRILEGMELVLNQNYGYNEFKKEGSKLWGISERAAEAVYKEIRDRLKERYQKEADEILQTQVQRLIDLYQRCKLNNNMKIELETLIALNKLYGIEQPKKIDITSGGEKLSINIIINDDGE